MKQSNSDILAGKILAFMEIVTELFQFTIHLTALFVMWIAPLIVFLLFLFVIVGIPLILMLTFK
jgi:hypothetical protein